MVGRREVCLKSRVWKQSLKVSPIVENSSLEEGDEDRVYEPSVGDEVEGNGNGDGRWKRSSCMCACDGRSKDPKMYSHLNTTRLYSPKDCKE